MLTKFANLSVTISVPLKPFSKLTSYFEKKKERLLVYVLGAISIAMFMFYLNNGVGLAYNDARSHLDIGRRVVEGLKPGLAQLGSVWLPLPHVLMIPTVWHDYLWHSGLAGALQSMLSFIACGTIIYLYLKKLNVGLFGRLLGVALFVFNLNVLYLQSTAMTELLLLATMMAGSYYLMLWAKSESILDLIKAGLWIFISTLVRYDGWFLLAYATTIIGLITLSKKGVKEAEGIVILFATLASFGIVLWLIWNYLIFNDPLYFAFGPFSAHTQQSQLAQAGELYTKGNLLLSVKVYFYAFFYNTYTIPALVSVIGVIKMFLDNNLSKSQKLAISALVSPFIFNVLALYMGHSVLFVQGVIGDTWFNVRYGMMLIPSVAIFIGYLVDKYKNIRFSLTAILALVIFFGFVNYDAVTIDDALIGASGKNVAEVSGWLKDNAKDKKGFILISAASHDAIIFSSGLPIKRFIHEGTGKYWEKATDNPENWATWIVMRTHDLNDLTFRELKDKPGLNKYKLVDHYPFADIYELKPEYVGTVETEPTIIDPD